MTIDSREVHRRWMQDPAYAEAYGASVALIDRESRPRRRHRIRAFAREAAWCLSFAASGAFLALVLLLWVATLIPSPAEAKGGHGGHGGGAHSVSAPTAAHEAPIASGGHWRSSGGARGGWWVFGRPHGGSTCPKDDAGNCKDAH